MYAYTADYILREETQSFGSLKLRGYQGISRNIKEYVINAAAFVLHMCINGEIITYFLISWIHFSSDIWNVIFFNKWGKEYRFLPNFNFRHQVFNVIIWRLDNNICHRHENWSSGSYKTSPNLTFWQTSKYSKNILELYCLSWYALLRCHLIHCKHDDICVICNEKYIHWEYFYLNKVANPL